MSDYIVIRNADNKAQGIFAWNEATFNSIKERYAEQGLTVSKETLSDEQADEILHAVNPLYS